MKFNTKTRYGLRTILELALNENNEGGILQKDIAIKQDVSVKYLDHIIAKLKSAGLIINVGGKKSGYKLTRPAKDITIFDVFLAFEEKLAIIDCLHSEGECPRKETCVLKGFWCNLNDSMKSQMQSVNMKMLATNHRKSDDTGKVA